MAIGQVCLQDHSLALEIGQLCLEDPSHLGMEFCRGKKEESCKQSCPIAEVRKRALAIKDALLSVQGQRLLQNVPIPCLSQVGYQNILKHTDPINTLTHVKKYPPVYGSPFLLICLDS